MTAFLTDERTYDVVLDGAVRRRALIVARVVDAVTNGSVTPLRAGVDRRGATIRIGSGGTLAVSGRIEQLLPGSALASSMTFTIAIRARGYRPHVEPVVIAPGSTLPIDLDAIALQPLPVRLEGRVTTEADRKPVAAASIVTPKPDRIVLLRTPVQRDYAAGTAVTARTLIAGGTVTTLTSPVTSGTRSLILDDASGLSPANVVRLAEREYAVITAVDGNAVTLTDPLQHSHGAGTVVAPVTVSAAQSTINLLRPVHAGDALLPVDAETDASAIEIGGEYHDTGLLSAADGWFSADGIAGERTLTLITTAPPLPLNAPPTLNALTTKVTIDYSKQVNAVSLRLKRT